MLYAKHTISNQQITQNTLEVMLQLQSNICASALLLHPSPLSRHCPPLFFQCRLQNIQLQMGLVENSMIALFQFNSLLSFIACELYEVIIA